MAKTKELKRLEAEERNTRTPHERTRKHRLGRCDCPDKTYRREAKLGEGH